MVRRVTTPPLDLLRPGRSITGMSAVLLPHRTSTEVDWPAFEAHVARTAAAGLVPAVNMDTGFVHLLSSEQRAEVLSRTRSLGVDFVAGAFDVADVEAVQALGGTPVIFPSPATHDVVPAYERVAASADRFIGFELSPVFNEDGRIWDLDTYRAVLAIPSCIGAKHSSLQRQPEWDRLRLRDELRPDFLVLTGNDLAIDMVMYGSDYLLGISTFAPDEFAARDRCWAAGDIDGFLRLNDLLQWLGTTAFRAPVPAYRHDAALFLQLRGWATGDATPDGAPRRKAWELDLLRDIAGAMGVLP
jgi:dihydrodipicolinate synthase/N-acetylneuraminate lyase